MSGGSPQTTVSQNGPPQVFLDAYGRVVNRAENVAATPYEAYPGETVAGFSPDQMAAMNTVRGAQGISAPYINQAADYIDQSTGPLLNGVPQLSQNLLQGQVAAGLQNLQQATDSGIADSAWTGSRGIADAAWTGGRGIADSAWTGSRGIADSAWTGGQGISDSAWTGGRGITDAATSLTPQSIAPWMSPYTESVVDATRRQFGHSNEQQRQGVVGNAISRGAWGGDRSAVAEAILAGEQQMAQAPVLAGLMDRGYQSGLGAAQNAAQLRTQGATAAGNLGLQGATAAGNLGLQGATAAGNLGLQGATSAGGIGLQGATAAGNLGFQGATNDAQQRQQAAAQLLGLFTGQQGLGFNANQAQAQLAQQAGYGMAGLGREAQSSTLTGAQAMAGMGALQQEQAQRQLNVPYQQFMAAQQYPFQTTGWLSNITSGLGGAAGGTKTETAPGPSTLSQLGGLGMAGLSAVGGTGGFGADGWLTNLFAKGGEIRVRPDDIEADYDWLPDADAPDLTLSIVPGADGMRVVGQRSGLGKTPNILQSTGTTSTTSGGGGPLSSILGLAGTVAGSFLPFPGGSVIGGMAGRALGSAFAEGGDVPMVDMVAGTRPGSRIPRLNFGPPGQGLGAGVPQFAPGELPVLQQAVAGLGGNGGVDDYLAQTMRGASFAKPNFYVPPPPAVPQEVSPLAALDQARAELRTFLESDRIAGGPEGGGGSDAGAEMGGDMGGPSDAADNMGGTDDGGYRSGGIVRRAEGGFMEDEDLPLPPIPPEDEDLPLPPIPPEDGAPAEKRPIPPEDGAPAEKRPGFMAAGNPWNALMYAGLGTMGGTSPNALTNIGRGAMVGLQQFGKERTSAEAIAARRANAAALERYRAQRADIAARRLANQERKTDADILRSEAQTNKLIAAVGAGGGGGGGRAKVTWDPAINLDADGKEVPGYNRLSNNGDPPQWFPAAQAAALFREAGRNTRAADRIEAQAKVNAWKEAQGWNRLDIAGRAAATARFAAENRLTIDEARLALAGKTAEARGDDAKKSWVARRAGQLQADMRFRGDALAQAEKDYESLVGKGGGAPAAVAKPQPTPEQAAQAIRIGRDAIAKGVPKKDVIQRLRDAGVTVPDDF
jgi:hypothetical protein